MLVLGLNRMKVKNCVYFEEYLKLRIFINENIFVNENIVIMFLKKSIL